MTEVEKRRRSLASRARHIVEERMWRDDLAALAPWRRRAVLASRVLVAAARGFLADRCTLRAAALTYVTLMAVVPVIALGISAARGLGAEEKVHELLQARLADMPESLRQGVERVFEYVQNTKFGTLTAIGVVALIWTAVALFQRVERAFNEIWKVRRGRAVARRYAAYLGVLFVAPVLLVAASGLNAAVTASPLVAWLRDQTAALSFVTKAATRAVPLLVVFLAFAALYRTIPRTKVPPTAALAGGAVAAVLWHLVQRLYFGAQVGVAKYNAIYGSLASLPLLLLYIYFGWSVILFGAEVAYASHHARELRALPSPAPPSFRALRTAAVVFVSEVARSFRSAEGPWSPAGLSAPAGLSPNEVEEVLARLVAAGVLARAEEPRAGYLPAKPLEAITLREVVAAVRDGRHAGPPLDPGIPVTLQDALRRADEAADAAVEGVAFDRPASSPG